MLSIISICLEAAILILVAIIAATKRSSKKDSKSLLELRDLIIRFEGKLDQTAQDFRSGIQELETRMKALTDEMGQRHISLMESIGSKLAPLQSDLTEKISSGQSAQSAQTLKMKETVENTLSQLGRDIRDSASTLTTEVKSRLDEVHIQLAALSEKNEQKQDALRQTIENKLEKLQESNSGKLEEMRLTVDEKLHSTLEKRLTESFGLVTDQLGKVQTGLGEMKELATGVGDLKRVLTNVKARGGVGELLLHLEIDNILAPDQYIKNARIKPNTQECVEYAIRIPNGDQEELLLPVDSKFLQEDWGRLEEAIQSGSADDISSARKKLETTVRGEAKKISDKYIFPPVTTPFALMHLPTEGLFAEVARIPGLINDLHTHYRVSIVGPTTFMAILNALQMGFRAVAIQKKGAEVWQVLAAAKVEFGKFGTLMNKVEGQVQIVQTTLGKINSKTRTINRKLGSVDTLQMQPVSASAVLGIAASDDDDEEA